MMTFPVNVVLTCAFALTGLYCLFHLVQSRGAAESPSRTLTDAQVVDVNHVIMSLAMILMTWMMFGDALLWMQVVLFALLAMSLVPNWTRARTSVERTDVATHLTLDVAMVWMLAAMPLLMAGMAHGSGGGHGGQGSHATHGGQEMSTAAAATPAWTDAVNWLFVVACAVAAAWWVFRGAQGQGHRWHAACHALMAAAMSVMLVAMNA